MEQSRKKFLKHFLIGATSVPLILEACKKDDITTSGDTGSGTETGSGSGSCSVSPTETAGPFPTKTPSSLVRSDIRADRTGVAITINITIANTNNSCAVLAGAIVDIWHCDKDGYYSEYGGSGMQTVNYTAVHFLRGRQTTDANGLVSFTSIFPGWYSGRATHIHVHIYNASGASLLVTQISFPEGSSSAVATVNGSGGTAYGYTKGVTGYTYNAADNVFSDDTAGVESATVTGSLATGYTLAHTIKVAA
ncbi:MAG: intradiol ring-cleavage dioxygenase [Chitinophagaceae bacterium]